MFIFDGLNEYLIATKLDERGIHIVIRRNEQEAEYIKEIIINIRYTGKYTYNRTSQKLNAQRIFRIHKKVNQYN
ncbi:recombinase family protein [Escherichia coli]